MIDRTVSPKYTIPDKIAYKIPNKLIMQNGISLYTISLGSQDVMRFVMVFNAGKRFQNQALVAAATLNMLSEGSLKYTSKEIAEKLDFYGSSFEVNIDRDWAMISVYCLTKYCNETLHIIEEVIKNPIFVQQELDIYVQKQKQSLQIEQEKIAFIARKLFQESLYGAKHPYGSSGNVSDYDCLTRNYLVDYHNKRITSSNVFMVLAGNIGNKEQKIVEQYFGTENWGDCSSSYDRWFEPTIESKKELFFEKSDTLQAAIRIGRVLFPKNHRDNTGIQVLNTILGGYFGSRLMRNIREDKGYTYGIYSIIASHEKSGYLSIITEANVEYTKAILFEIKKEIITLQNELLDNEELNLVKQYMYGEMLRTLDGPWGQSEVCIDIVQSNLPDNYVNLFFNEVKNITVGQIQQLAQKYLNLDTLYEVVVGK